jgi:hypothetical protein
MNSARPHHVGRSRGTVWRGKMIHPKMYQSNRASAREHRTPVRTTRTPDYGPGLPSKHAGSGPQRGPGQGKPWHEQGPGTDTWSGLTLRMRSPLRRRPNAATWLVARDISQRAEPDVRPLDRADSAFITERTRRLSTLLTGDVPPQHLLRLVHSAGRRRQGHPADSSPVQSIVETVRPCCTVHCAHHPLYEKLPPARRGDADLGCQGTRRLPQQQILVAPSTTSAMFLGPHVGAQYPCTCPPLAIKGEACNVTTQAQS